MDIDQAVKGYFNKRKELETSWSDPHKVGDILFKLATYLTYIGDELGNLKARYEHDRAARYIKLISEGKSASAAENLTRSDMSLLRGQIAKLEVTHKNGWSLVSIGQSRLRSLEKEQNI